MSEKLEFPRPPPEPARTPQPDDLIDLSIKSYNIGLEKARENDDRERYLAYSSAAISGIISRTDLMPLTDGPESTSNDTAVLAHMTAVKMMNIQDRYEAKKKGKE